MQRLPLLDQWFEFDRNVKICDMFSVTHDGPHSPTRAGFPVEDETTTLFELPTKIRVVKGIVRADVTVRAGHVGKYGAVRELHNGALFTHPLMKPHGPAQRLSRVGQVPGNDVGINSGRNAVEINRGDLAYAEFLFVGD